MFTFNNRPAPKWAWPLIAIFMIVAVLFLILLLVVTLPITIPGHFILRALGRRGFFSFADGIKIKINAEAFDKA